MMEVGGVFLGKPIIGPDCPLGREGGPNVKKDENNGKPISVANRTTTSAL